MSSEDGARTYNGRCHCGSVQFRIRSEPIGQGCRCNCSICIRRGAVMSARYYDANEFELLHGADELRVYRFGDELVEHTFCGRCGINPFAVAIDVPGGRTRVNLGCLDEVDVLALEVTLIDGRSF